jgi:large subunit ribosomal protein L32e
MSLKANLGPKEKSLLESRKEQSRKRPKFHRQEWFRYKKLGDAWRKARGKHSKLREHRGHRPPNVDSGYRGPKAVRYLHPSGFKEVYITNLRSLQSIDPSKEAIRISSKVGMKKRTVIQETAKTMGIKILNEVK